MGVKIQEPEVVLKGLGTDTGIEDGWAPSSCSGLVISG